MAKMKQKTLKEHTLSELGLKYDETKRELFHLKNEYRLNKQLKKPHMLNRTKKDIARILTEINSKKNLELKGDK
jgi:ribosomal protein L29